MVTALEFSTKEVKDYIKRLYNPSARLESREWLKFSGDVKLSLDGGISQGNLVGIARVSGVEDEVYQGLEGKRVYLWRGKLVKRRRDKYEKLQKDVNGKDIWGALEKPDNNSVGVVSSVNLEIPYGYSNPQGYAFSDVLPTGEYMYYLPKSVLYAENPTCLVISSKKNLRAYNGWSLQTYEFGRVYIGIIPWRLKMSFDRSVVLGVKVGCDWEVEVDLLLQWMEDNGIMPRIDSLPDEIVDELGLLQRVEGVLGEYREREEESMLERERRKAEEGYREEE